MFIWFLQNRFSDILWVFGVYSITFSITWTNFWGMLNPNFLRKDTKNTSSYHFVSIIPKELRNQFGNRTRFTISLRTGIYRDALSISHKLYAICQIIYQKIRMESERFTTRSSSTLIPQGWRIRWIVGI